MHINRYTLSFKDENEKYFREKYFEESLAQFRLSFLIVTFLYGIFGYLDSSLIAEFKTLFYIIRFAVVIPLLLLVFLFSYFKKFKIIWQGLIVLCYITGGAGITIMIVKAPENFLYYTGMMLIFSAGYFFITLRFIYATLASWSIFLIFNIGALFFTQMTTPIIIGADFFFGAANLIGMFAAYNIEFYKRKDFVLKQQLDQQNLEITEANKNLERKVELRTKELMAAKEKAEESDRLKSAFLANMSHEIRTPMNGILGFTNLLNDPDFSGEEKQDFIQIIKKSGSRMLNTVNDLIDIAKIETGQMPVNFTFDNILVRIENLIQFFSSEAKEKNISLIFNCRIPSEKSTMKTDTGKFDSILTNLIKNAVKYTDSGTIEIGCSSNGNIHEFYVRDTGLGIPKNRQEAIFNRFEQADIKNPRAFQGSGLGLAIVKAYVEMLGGNIRVESVEGKGSTFIFTITAEVLSKKKVKSQNITERTFENNAHRNIKVIVAEDDDSGFLYLHTILNSFDFEIIRTQTGTETVEQMRQHSDIDIILMDINMPEMNGYTATREIRAFNNNVKIIAQTAFSLTGDKEKALDAGCNHYISKPINKNELLILIQQSLQAEL